MSVELLQAAPGTIISIGSPVSPSGEQGPPGIGSNGGGETATSTIYEEVGTIKGWPTTNVPDSWMECDGRELVCDEYPELYALIGSTYGGTALEVFNIPNLRGRTLVGLSGESEANTYLGQTGGEETHVLSVTEMPSHTHIQNAHSHTLNGLGDPGVGGGWGASWGNINPQYYATDNHTAVNQNTGGGAVHNNMPPYLIAIYIIKVKPTVGAAEPIPIADETQDGLLARVSGLATDYVGGDNQCHPLPEGGNGGGGASGITDGSEAAAGEVGEYVEVKVDLSASLFTAVPEQTVDVLTLDLTDGDWQIWGFIQLQWIFANFQVPGEIVDGIVLTAPANGYVYVPIWVDNIISHYMTVGGQCSSPLVTPLSCINPVGSGGNSKPLSWSNAYVELPMVRQNIFGTAQRSFRLKATVTIHSPSGTNLTLKSNPGGYPMVHARLCARRIR